MWNSLSAGHWKSLLAKWKILVKTNLRLYSQKCDLNRIAALNSTYRNRYKYLHLFLEITSSFHEYMNSRPKSPQMIDSTYPNPIIYLDSYTNDNKISKHILINHILGNDLVSNSMCILCNMNNSVDHILDCPNFNIANHISTFIGNLHVEADLLWKSDKYQSLINEIGSALRAKPQKTLKLNTFTLFCGILNYNLSGLTKKSVFGIYKNKKLYRFLCKSLVNFYQSIVIETLRKDTYVQILKHVIS